MLHFYTSPASMRKIAQTFERDLSSENLPAPETGKKLILELHPIEPWQSMDIGPYHVTAIPANHDPGVESLLCAVQFDEHCIFYGTDSATLPEETWQGLHEENFQFDLVILDHTYGPDEPGADHLSAQQFVEHVSRMREEGLASKNSRAFATHIVHEGNPPHPQIAVFAAEHGYEIAYDGLIVDVE